MPKKYTTNKVVDGNLHEHPAVQAWHDLGLNRLVPARLVVLKEHRKKPWVRKSAVYRLENVGPRGSSIVAKRCKRVSALTERAVYESVLPRARVPTLAYYGCLDEPDTDFCWLFIEDAQGVEFSKKDVEHRVAAAKWLALMHGATHQLEQAASLPDRGPNHYLEHLESGFERLGLIVGNPALTTSDSEILRDLVDDLEVLRSSWSRIERFCSEVPHVLAHGDFVAKNIRVRTLNGTVTVAPFDWETSGWGLPAADIGASASPELGTYWSVAREVWPQLDLDFVRQVALVGNAFRVAAAIDWACRGFSAAWPEQTMGYLIIYRTRLRDCLAIAPWNG